MNQIDLNKFNKCTCGKTINDLGVSIQYNYNWIGWFWWTMGATAIPKKITFKCESCNKIFDTLNDRELIKYYIFYRSH
jgi:hypothetical protein